MSLSLTHKYTGMIWFSMDPYLIASYILNTDDVTSFKRLFYVQELVQKKSYMIRLKKYYKTNKLFGMLKKTRITK